MTGYRAGALTVRRIAFNAVSIAVTFYAIVAADTWLVAGLRVDAELLPWQQFAWGLAFLPAFVVFPILPAAALAGWDRRRAYWAGGLLGLLVVGLRFLAGSAP